MLMNMENETEIPSVALSAVLKKSSLCKEKECVKGYDFNGGLDYAALFQSYKFSGFQATNFGLAVEEINKMVDCLVTSAGGVEEDIIKCLAPTIVGDFSLDGASLRKKGLNRIGNLLVPNDNYCLFEDWVMPVLDELLEEQKSKSIIWSPSKIITRLGEKISNPDSICYWAAKNSIPIFSPALTDGSLGDMIYFHSFRNPGLIVDIAQDIRRINSISVKAKNSGMIILGGGVIKHHICNSNLMRNGADYAVYINTGNEFDGSDSGAKPDEAVSWGKIKMTAKPIKVYADATLVFPILVGQTFAEDFHKRNSNA